jgi:hypothetical protein
MINKNFPQGLSRPDKILVVLYGLSKGTTKNLHYEDIVVALFKKYPKDFAMRGYPKYPDSEGVNHEFYRGGMKKSGLINYSNKIFSLTDKGLNHVENILKSIVDKKPVNAEKLSRFAGKEIGRIRGTEGFKLFIVGETQKVNDTDFYAYLGITPRTSKIDFLGRLNTVTDAVAELKRRKDKSDLDVKTISYHRFILEEKFKSIVDYFNKS